jgi:hypothetical protein
MTRRRSTELSRLKRRRRLSRKLLWLIEETRLRPLAM